ncbi:MAG: 16S rRNA (cytosine(1402)-N(4))-methyltransferase RsmH [Saprospiraceae bacterium]
MPETYKHIPVLLKQSVDQLITSPDGTYVDVTFGGGGHSKEILNRLSEKGKLFAFDTDKQALKNEINNDSRFQLIHSNFRYLKKYLRYFGIQKVDGILADLGVSSHHLDELNRGFSFQSDYPLDMRMNEEQEFSAEDILMNYSEDQLTRMWTEYGELTNSKKIAAQWVRERRTVRAKKCNEFANWVEPFIYGPRNKFLAKLFQGLRIEVNEEIKCLQELLSQSDEVLAVGSRLVVLSYHSLEDRLVKNFIKGELLNETEYSSRGRVKKFKVLTKDVILADEEELNKNSRSRSVRMRSAEKIMN